MGEKVDNDNTGLTEVFLRKNAETTPLTRTFYPFDSIVSLSRFSLSVAR